MTMFFKTPPWEIQKRDGKYCVVKLTDGSTEKCHPTRQEAVDHMRALYASEGKAMAWTSKILESIAGLFEKETWTTAYVNDLPDSSFLFIEPGCDNKGCRHLPYKDANGKVDLPHLRNAISRLGQEATGKGWKGFNRQSVLKKAQGILARQKGLYMYKDYQGEWWLLGIVTNNRLDREKEILTTDAHRYFVNAIDSGAYKELMGHDMPEFWVAHIPVPVGDAKMVAYDERGFIVTAIKQRAGEFYTKVFEGLYEVADTLGMSHGMPNQFLKKEKADNGFGFITQYLSKEFTALSLSKAANFLTSTTLAVKELYGDMFEIGEEKRSFLVETFGEDVANEFDRRVKDLADAADAAGIPKKELNMAEDEKALEEKESAEQPETEVKEKPVTEVKADAMPSDEEEDEEEQAPPKKEVEPQYMTHADAKAMAAEIVKGVTEANKALMARIDGLESQIKEYREEEDRIKKQVEMTPWAGLAGQLSQSVVGKEETLVDGRKKEFKGPEEASPAPVGGTGVGIASIDQMIQRQRSGARRVVPAFVPQGQRE